MHFVKKAFNSSLKFAICKNLFIFYHKYCPDQASCENILYGILHFVVILP